jgi:integrase
MWLAVAAHQKLVGLPGENDMSEIAAQLASLEVGTPLVRALRLIESARALLLTNGTAAIPNTTTENGLTLSDVYEGWLARRVSQGLRNVPNERGQLENHVLPILGKLPLAEIRVRHIRDLVDRLRASTLAPRTVRSIYGTVHKLFADLVVDEVLSSTPCVLTKDQLPRLRDKDPEWRAGALFARAELELLIATELVPWDRRVFNAIKFFTGARFGEAAGLRWRDLDENAEPLKRLTISRSYNRRTKTDAARAIPVHPVLDKMLGEWKRSGFVALMGREAMPDDLIVPSRRGRMRSRHQHRNKFLDDLKRIGLRPRRVHDTRRTFITLARVGGARCDVLEQITHTARRDVMNLYTTLPWPTLCDAIKCLRARRIGTKEIRRRLRTIRAAARRAAQQQQQNRAA